MGQNHGSPPKKDPRRLSLLSPSYPYRTANATEDIGMNNWKATCIERCTCSLVGGQWKRAVYVPRQWPTQLANRKRKVGWLPPSIESRIANSMTWVERLRKVAPITAISQELVKFDMQQMEHPEISGVEYQ